MKGTPNLVILLERSTNCTYSTSLSILSLKNKARRIETFPYTSLSSLFSPNHSVDTEAKNFVGSMVGIAWDIERVLSVYIVSDIEDLSAENMMEDGRSGERFLLLKEWVGL
ncbi:hypothetical protein CEXT_808991 [Caerostris extrusa]|uniref:Uncharacterized protein n=1 Tax=Caerostris extrusa TaxID=172846 RepID=A0AAV4Y9F3_CAEEX|nr:hypothetical protein CEXT_808991 [Caerostris extrusa]